MKFSMNQRLDCFILWQHGFKFIFETLDSIEDNNFKILEIKKIKTSSINKFLKIVYSHDYAPYIHLKSKLKYLKKSKNKYVYIISVLNNNKDEFFSGDKIFKHIESNSMNTLKWNLRKKYNDKDSKGNFTHNHIIHGTDSESQAIYLMKKFKFKYYLQTKGIFPSHIYNRQSFELKKILTNSITSNLIIDKMPIEKPLNQTPHFLSLKGQRKEYENYLKSNLGIGIMRYHSLKKFDSLLNLIKNSNSFKMDPIILSKDLKIIDGVHRASILCYLGHKEINSIVLK